MTDEVGEGVGVGCALVRDEGGVGGGGRGFRGEEDGIACDHVCA